MTYTPPKLDESFLHTHTLPNEPTDIGGALHQSLIADNHKPWTRTLGVFHPSTIGANKCDRALAYDRLGTVPQPLDSPKMRMYGEMGTSLHNMLQSRLERTLKHNYTPEVLVEIPELHVSGHMDARFRIHDDWLEWVHEIKTISEDAWRRLRKPKAEHLQQVHLYMYGTRIPRVQFTYISRDSGSYKTLRAPFSMGIWNTAAQRITNVERVVASGNLPNKKLGAKCYECKFNHVCMPEGYTVEDINALIRPTGELPKKHRRSSAPKDEQ